MPPPPNGVQKYITIALCWPGTDLPNVSSVEADFKNHRIIKVGKDLKDHLVQP